jgi:polyhydroxyalkanoate synthesis regulator phasin
MIETTVLIAVCGLAISAATFFIGRMTAAKSSGAADGEMKADIKHIKDSVEKQEKKLDVVVENYEDVKLEIERLKGRLKALEQKVEYLHGGE